MKRIVLLFLLGLSTSVFAQQRDTITQLSEVVVTSTRSEIQLENSPIPTEVIGKDEIEISLMIYIFMYLGVILPS